MSSNNKKEFYAAAVRMQKAFEQVNQKKEIPKTQLNNLTTPILSEV